MLFQKIVRLTLIFLIALGGGSTASERFAHPLLRKALTQARRGLIVQIGLSDTKLLEAAWRHAGLVHGLGLKEEHIAAVKEALLSRNLWGRVVVEKWRTAPGLPYVDNLVDLILVAEGIDVPREEILRVLAPYGRALIQRKGKWEEIVKPFPEDTDQWTHFLHGPDNNAVARDRTIAAPRGIQWLAGPKWGRSHEELASVSALVTARGRLFYIIDEGPLFSICFPSKWRLVARNAFNGLLLWKRKIARWVDRRRHFRSGPVHLPRRLVAVGDRVYVTLGLGEPVSVLDARTGKTLRLLEGTEFTEEIVYSDGVLYLVVGTSEVVRCGGGLFMEGEPEPTDFRFIAAYDPESGKRLWKRDFSKGPFLLPLTLTVCGERVFYKTGAHVGCLNARTGRDIWKTPSPSPKRRMSWSAPTLVAAEGVLLCADRVPEGKDQTAGSGPVEWGVDGWNVRGFKRRAKSVLKAYDAETGKELWQCPCNEGYNSPVDVFVINGLVYIGTDYQGRDLRTGKIKVTLQARGAPVAMPHHRCYRNKATERYIFTSRSGIELVSVKKGWVCNNSWIRGTCQYGIVPANGLLYAPPDACACYFLVKVAGLFAARTCEGGLPMPTPAPGGFERGPGWGTKPGEPAGSGDWPVYRRDNFRSGAASQSIGLPIGVRWETKVAEKLTQPIVVGRRIYVADSERFTLYALDKESGAEVWRFGACGRIDSPPAYLRGFLFFGCGDGRLYCLRARDGELVWRLRLVPQDRRVVAFGRLESIWPAHAACLVQNDSVYVVAGRSSYLDGGLLLCRVDPWTGKVLARQTVYHLDPETGRQLGWEDPKRKGFDMEGVRSDVLVGDGESVFVKHFRFSADLKPVSESEPHLFAINDLLAPEWFIRSYWLLGTDVGAGWSGWAFMGNLTPAGRILVFDKRRVFGYGRKRYLGGPAGHRGNEYHLFGMRKELRPISAFRGSRRRRGKANTKPFLWTKEDSPLVRALVLAGDKLFLAGSPDPGQWDRKRLVFLSGREALEAFEGKRGVFLQVRSTADGKLLQQLSLPAKPAWDAMVSAGGRLFISLEDGRLLCLAPAK